MEGLNFSISQLKSLQIALPSIRTTCSFEVNELSSKYTLSCDVGIDAPGTPPETNDQWLGSFHEPLPLTQYFSCAKALLIDIDEINAAIIIIIYLILFDMSLNFLANC